MCIGLFGHVDGNIQGKTWKDNEKWFDKSMLGLWQSDHDHGMLTNLQEWSFVACEATWKAHKNMHGCKCNQN